MRKWINICENIKIPKVLFHATNEINIKSIMEKGLLVEKYGDIHGRMDYCPPSPCIYLSRNSQSNNLHGNLFANGPVKILKIDTEALDNNMFYPDDALGYMFAEEEILQTPRSVAVALNIDIESAAAIFEKLENSSDEELIKNLKPFWKWYLLHPKGGEVSYSRNIPVSALVF